MHDRIRNRWFLARRQYYRYMLDAPTLELYFPLYMEPLSNIQVGERVAISAFVHILANSTVTIGDDTIIAAHVQIATSTHDYFVRPYRSFRANAPVSIGRNVWIGSGAIILPGVRIGDNAVVGAGSVVTKDVPEDTLVVGVPARITRRLAGIERPAANTAHAAA